LICNQELDRIQIVVGGCSYQHPLRSERVTMALPVGEKALTIADVDHVIDSVVDRTSADDKQGQVLIAFGLHAFVLVLVISAIKGRGSVNNC
jgi:hypothetical protein